MSVAATKAGNPATPEAPRLARATRRRLVIAAVVLVLLGAAGAWLLTMPRPQVPRDAALREGDAARGKLIFTAGDCASCHATPGQADRLVLGGGLPLPSPYGTLYVPNISTDPDDGIGRWSTADLVNAVMSGVSPDGKHYYPVLPYPSYAHMRRDDVLDLIAYLRTLPAVKGRAPDHDLAFPFNVRRLIGFWKLLYFDRTTIVDDPSRSVAWNRGHYLSEAVSHCGECHSSRNLFGAIREKTRHAGGSDPENTGYSPNITATGLGSWNEDDVVRVLTEGTTPDGRTAGSSMAEVVANASMLPEADRRALAVYVKSLPALPTPAP